MAARVREQEYEMVAVDTLQLHPKNANKGDAAAIQDSIGVVGFYGVCVVNKKTRQILAGNYRYLAAKNAGLQDVPVVWVDVTEQEAEHIMVADNRLRDIAGTDERKLAALLQGLPSLEGTGFDREDLANLLRQLSTPNTDRTRNGALLQEFGCPPMSVLDGQQGYWLERRRWWEGIGVDGSEGKEWRALAVRQYMEQAHFSRCVCFSCGNAADALKAAGLEVLTVSEGAELRAGRWWTQADVHKWWPDAFDATSGHLPPQCMAMYATQLRYALDMEYGGLDVQGHYQVPSGSGETMVALSIAYPGVLLMPLYDVEGLEAETKYEEGCPLNGLVKSLTWGCR